MKLEFAKMTMRGLLLALLFVPMTLSAQTVIDNLMAAHQWNLADAYYQVGERFVKLGDQDRGNEFMAAAKKIFPAYHPGAKGPNLPVAQEPQIPPPVPTLKSVPVVAAVVDQNLQGEKIARIQFTRLLTAYLMSDPTALAGILDDPIIVTGKGGQAISLTLAQAQFQAQDFLQKNPVAAASPNDLYKMDTLKITEVPKTAGPSYLLTIEAQPTPPGGVDKIPFWAPSQSFLFNRVGDLWKIESISAP